MNDEVIMSCSSVPAATYSKEESALPHKLVVIQDSIGLPARISQAWMGSDFT
jgi:hypothetical protein